jgi:hypothetical protein
MLAAVDELEGSGRTRHRPTGFRGALATGLHRVLYACCGFVRRIARFGTEMAAAADPAVKEDYDRLKALVDRGAPR